MTWQGRRLWASGLGRYQPGRERGTVRRYLLVLDMDLLVVDEQLGLEPIGYLLARQEEQPCEVVVLFLADRQARLPALELLLGTSSNVTKFPVVPSRITTPARRPSIA